MQNQNPETVTLSDILSTEGLSYALISNLPGGAAFVVDRDLRYLLAEGEALSVAGFKPGDLVGKTIFEVLPPDLAASYEPMYHKALAGEPFEHEHHAHSHWYISRGTPLRAENGEIYAVLAVSYDITERKRVEDERKYAEVALRESEARLQSIANLVPDLLWDSEPDGSTNWYNHRWMEYTGQTVEQAIGWSWTDAIHPDDREGSAQRYREAVEQGMPLQQEHRIRRHDGAYRWFVVKASPLKDESGEVIKMYGAATDIHEQRVALEALRESEERFRTLANTAPALIWFNDAQGNNCFINQHFLDFTGKSAEQIRGEGWHELVHPDDAENYIADYLTAVREQRPWSNRNRIRRHDGVWRWHDNYAQPLFSGDGVYLGHVGVTIDNTDAIEAEINLRESEAKYRTLFNAMEEGFCSIEVVYDEDGQPVDHRILEANPAFERHTGLTDVQGRLASELMPGIERFWSELYARVVATGESERLEQYSAAFDRWFDVEVSRVGDELLHRVAVIFRDITSAKHLEEGRKRAEADLRESEEKYRSLFESIDEGFCIIERVTVEPLDFRYLAANSAFVAQSGIQDVVGKTIRQVVPDEPEEWFEIYDHVLTTHEPIRFERELVTVGRKLELYAFPVTDHSDNQLAVIFKDITERKRVEDERKRREANLAFLADLMSDFAPLATAEEIMDMAGKRIAEHLDLSRCLFVEINPEAGECTHLLPSRPAGQLEISGSYRLADYHTEEENRLLSAGHSMVVNDVRDGTRSPEQMAAFEVFDIASIVNTSYLSNGRWVFDLGVTRSKPSVWREDEIELLREISARVWLRIERARAEADLRQSEAKYRTLFDSIDEGLAIVEIIYDDQGEIVDIIYRQVNRAYERHGGIYNLVRRSIFDVIPGVEDYWLDLYNRVAKTGEAVREKNYQQDVDRWFDVYFSRVDDNGRFVAIVFSDITERKRREVLLRENEARQAFLLKLSDILQQFVQPNDIKAAAMCLLGEHLGVSRAQYHECDSSGEYYSADGVGYANGLPLLDLKYRIDAFGTFVNEDFAAGRPYRIDDLEVDPRVSAEEREAYRSYQIRAGAGVPLIRGGKLVAILAIHDVQPHAWTDLEMDLIRETAERIWTPLERARAEAALRGSEQRLSVIFAQAAVGLSEISLDGHFEQVNDALCQMLGRSRQELLAATVPAVTHPEDVPKSLNALAQLLETGESISLDKRYLRPDGTVLWANSILTRLDDEHGQPHHILAVTLDVSDRQQAEVERLQRIQEQAAREEERQRAESLAELDRAKTAFFSNVSHEFRTPLTLSLAPLQDALSDCTHPLDPVHRERLELVHRNSLRLLKLVNTLLDFSRIEAGRMEAIYEPTDLAAYTAELASVFRSAIEGTDLQLIVDCPPLPEAVYIDREMWEKIVLNLLSNAFKFTFEGEIRVSLHSTNGNQAILQIQDTGTGIAPEHLPHLFERFYQVRSTQARTHEGSGIGLALVHELVQLQGGTIEVSSTVGEGTCFTIALPFGTDHLPSDRLHFEGDRYPVRTLASTAMGATAYVEEAERWLPAVDPPQPPLERGENSVKVPLSKGDLGGSSGLQTESSLSARVLVVDDNADMREYLTRILSAHVQVEAVADGVTALAVAQEQVPDLILSDVMMPGLDGFELLEALRADPRTREIPIILLSARAGEEAIVEGLEAGADDYLVKPFSAQELVSRITAHLQTTKQRGEALQEARSTLRSRDEFISVVSHELNTPLVSILGWTRMLRNSPPNPAMLSKALDTIERNAMLQVKLVQDLLDLSRISAGKLRLNPQQIELKPVIETAMATVSQTATDKGIDLTWQGNVTEPVVVVGDSDRLSQVLINLLSNAIKFTPESGSVTLELSVMNNDGSTNVSYAEIRVADTGDGIPADFLPYVFDRFRQAESANSAKGLGLGLAIARHIVELHGGTIHADSAGERQGATFTVRLPLLQDSES